MPKSRHDSECQIWRGGICTCGFLHDIRPYTDVWCKDEAISNEMARHEYLCEVLFELNDMLVMPPPVSEEEQARRHEEFKKMWKKMGGRIDGE